MNIVLPLLIATSLIAGLILLRMFAERYALRTKIRGGHTDSECEQTECFRSCDLDAVAPDTDCGDGQKTSKRGVHHAH